ncbi:sugar ABC transporter ATP-binding protein [Thermoflavimicrobium dichotomicum]|uniref:Ribose transport system ATP-binding protein n=1 Tax=Thermoflavimicrobium dichotomicum TaxID=46223 RepID=A0A1I3V3F7_9BACL|nr:sugar ABC transporter ATP-binding protein [Thermoflavimicrobium dichotomicum]SFJ88717.1 ribose transport system ATP-binding protein [Thermoflavimicrobium dichotomicum]
MHQVTDQSLILRMSNVGKQFAGVQVLKGVNLELYRGEVHALMGENGAGKSTLIKILSGVYQPDQGTIEYMNKKVRWSSPSEARNKGISVIHQELNLSPNISVAENIFMGTKFPKTSLGFIDWKKLNENARQLLHSLGMNLDPEAIVSSLSVAQQQMVEIARAFSIDSKVLVMDEPTATLTDKDISVLFKIINEFKKKGLAIVFISHRMKEIFRIADRCTVLRDGEWIKSMPISETNSHDLVRLMIGREPRSFFHVEQRDTSKYQKQQPVLQINQLQNKKLKNVSFSIHAGEIVGLYGLIGSGRTELVRAIYGADPIDGGEIYIQGNKKEIKNPLEAISAGIGLVPENRKEQGLFLEMSVKENVMIAKMKQLQSKGILRWKQIAETAKDYIQQLNIKYSSLEQHSMNLSGGNQQKILIARLLSMNPKVLLLDEPTRGIDVGAKAEIYSMIYKLAEQGVGVLFISSEMPEVLAVSDRILVMHEGALTAELNREEATQENIMLYATGVNQ